MRHFTLTAVCIATILLAGCSDKPVTNAASASAPLGDKSASGAKSARDIRMQGLMAAIFAKQFRPATGDALADLPDPDNHQHPTPYLVRPITSNPLPDGETALITNSVTADAQGNPETAHAIGGLLSIYFLRSVEGSWKVTRKVENIAMLGSYGSIGSVQWTPLGQKKSGVVILNSGSGQGESVTFMSIFDLTAPTIHDLAVEPIKLQSSNESGCTPERKQCWHVTGAWSFEPGDDPEAYADLVIHFTGKKAMTAADGAASQPITMEAAEEIDTTARYVFDGKGYRLTIGTNPVPEM